MCRPSKLWNTFCRCFSLLHTVRSWREIPFTCASLRSLVAGERPGNSREAYVDGRTRHERTVDTTFGNLTQHVADNVSFDFYCNNISVARVVSSISGLNLSPTARSHLSMYMYKWEPRTSLSGRFVVDLGMALNCSEDNFNFVKINQFRKAFATFL